MPRFILLFLPFFAFAADPQTWSRVLSLPSGERIEVISHKLKKTEGEFVSANMDSVQLRSASAVLSIPRPEVFRISRKGHSKRLRNVLLGAAVGAGVGLVIGAAKDASYSEDGEHLAKMLITPIGAGLGAAVGSALPAFETIYRAPPTQTRPATVP
jgi:hypothetical protein